MSRKSNSARGEKAAASANGMRKSASHGELYGLTCKVMLIGDTCVGKTCLLVRFKDNTFLSGSFISTVGIDFRNKVVDIEGTKVKLQIWDTAGQERFRSITRAYYRDADALLLLYDVTNMTSFENIRAWLGEIKEYAHDNVIIMLLGNKADMASERVVTYDDGEKLAKEYSIPFMETSAKTNVNIERAFMAVATSLKSCKVDGECNAVTNVADYLEREKKKQSCCGGFN